MDGTFTKDILNLTILMAASVDAANHAVLIAWAIVESENEDAWWFYPPPPPVNHASIHFHPLDFLVQYSHCNPTSQSPIYDNYG